MYDMRTLITLCEAARRESFAEVAKHPEDHVYTLMDVAARLGEDLSNYFAGDEEDTGEDYQEEAIAAQLRESAEKFLSHIRRGKMKLYRGMEVGKNWSPVKKGLGIYWTIRESAAFHGILLEGIIDVREVNLWETLAMEFTALTEDEVRLWPTAPILLTSIKLDGAPIMQQFWNKSYPAVVA
jgi:hypothetical protein